MTKSSDGSTRQGRPSTIVTEKGRVRLVDDNDGYNVAYKPITLLCISFISCHSYVMFVVMSMSVCND